MPSALSLALSLGEALKNQLTMFCSSSSQSDNVDNINTSISGIKNANLSTKHFSQKHSVVMVICTSAVHRGKFSP